MRDESLVRPSGSRDSGGAWGQPISFQSHSRTRGPNRIPEACMRAIESRASSRESSSVRTAAARRPAVPIRGMPRCLATRLPSRSSITATDVSRVSASRITFVSPGPRPSTAGGIDFPCAGRSTRNQEAAESSRTPGRLGDALVTSRCTSAGTMISSKSWGSRPSRSAAANAMIGLASTIALDTINPRGTPEASPRLRSRRPARPRPARSRHSHARR